MKYLEFFTIDVWTMIFTLVNMFIVYVIVKKLLFKPVLKVLDRRDAEIKKIYVDANEANAKAAYEKWYKETEELRKNVPSVTQYIAKNGSVPKLLSFSIAALISFYNGTEIKTDEKGAKYLESKREEGVYPNKDTLPVLEFFATLNKETKDAKVIANRVLSNVEFWKEDLTKYEGLEASVAANLADIQSKGMKAALADIVK